MIWESFKNIRKFHSTAILPISMFKKCHCRKLGYALNGSTTIPLENYQKIGKYSK